ncbi:MAG: calcium-binding protein, partial [Pseudomonadota bacterium]
MVRFEFVSAIGAGWGSFGTDIRDLMVLPGTGSPTVIASTGPSGGLTSLSLDGGEVQVVDTVTFSNAIGATIIGETALLTQGGQTYVIVGATGQQEAVGYRIDASGMVITPATPGLSMYAGDSGHVIATSGAGHVYTMTAPGLLQGFSEGAGGYQVVASLSDTADIALADPVALEIVTVGGAEFLVSLSEAGEGISVFQISPGSGALSATATIGPANGLGVLANPTELRSVEVAGKTYVIASSAADNGQAGALTVMELRPDGTLNVTDHIFDSLATRFGKASVLESAQVGDWTYVVAGGGDAGLSLFALAPGGRLLHLDTVVDTVLSGLETISALSLVAEGADLHVLAASQASPGLTHLTIDTGPQGLVREAISGLLQGQGQNDLLVGGAGNNELRGGQGADILLDGFGEDTLWGGAGADRFVLEADSRRDEIRDFEPGVDTLDLSAVPFLYDPSRLTVTERTWGAELRFAGGEETFVYSASGGPLTAVQIFAAIDWTVDRPPLIVTNQVLGNEGRDTITGTTATDIIMGLGENDSLSGLSGDDQIDGGEGADTLIGGEGQDSLYGGTQGDRFEGGAGDDTIEGGDGRDTAILGDGNDTFIDNTQTGWHGSDRVFGNGGDDSIVGGGGDDSLYGQDGDDTIRGKGENDYITGGNGFDMIDAGTGNDTVVGGNGRDVVYLGDGDDVFEDNAQNDTWGRDLVYGGIGNDDIGGGGGRDSLFGEDGDDTIRGGHENDHIDGGIGFDTIYAGFGHDTVLGGNGRDVVYLGNGNDVFEDNDQSDTWGRDLVYGEIGDDRLVGGGGNDSLDGGDGRDTISGGGEDDVLTGGSDNDHLDGGIGFDSIYAGTGNDTVVGGNGRDVV